MSCIYVVDDEQDLTWSLEKSLRYDGHEVVTASDGVEALQLMHRRCPDLAVVDVMMPKMDGIELCRHMRSDPTLSTVPVLLLTVKEAIADKVEGFEAGCDDYLTKPFDLRELKTRIEVLLRRRMHSFPRPVPDRLTVGSLSLDLHTFELTVGDRTVLLTPTAFNVLSYLMSHPGEIFSSQKLLGEVWGYPAGSGNPATVRWHMKNLREKIEPSPSDPVYLCTVARRGYTIPEP